MYFYWVPLLLDNTFYVLKIPKYFALLWPSQSSRADFEGFQVKFIYSEKATKICEISTVDLSYVVPVKSTVKILQNFMAWEYMNFMKIVHI